MHFSTDFSYQFFNSIPQKQTCNFDSRKDQEVFIQLAKGILHWIITDWILYVLTSNHKKQGTFPWNCIVYFLKIKDWEQ